MKILFTGTHFTPAQAVIEELKKLNQNLDIIYIGRKHTQEGDKTVSVESKVLPSLGVKFISITSGRLNRYLSWGTLISLFKIPIGFLQSVYFLLKEQPEIIVSFGGYVSVPVVIWGWLLSIPIIIHEQTLVTSLSGFITGIFADKIALTFENSNYSESKVVITGNPLRKEIISSSATPSPIIKKFIENAKKERKPIIFVTGGNQGSTLINNALLEKINEITEMSYVIHQTGDYKNEFENILKKKSLIKNPQRYLVERWFDVSDVSFIFRNISLAISRSGINTLLELAYFGIPTITIPLTFFSALAPNSFIISEQQSNAEFFRKKGLVKVIKQKELTGEKLFHQIEDMLNNLSRYKKEAERAKEIVRHNAEKKITQEILILASKSDF